MGNFLTTCCESEETNLKSLKVQFFRAAPLLLAQQATAHPQLPQAAHSTTLPPPPPPPLPPPTASSSSSLLSSSLLQPSQHPPSDHSSGSKYVTEMHTPPPSAFSHSPAFSSHVSEVALFIRHFIQAMVEMLRIPLTEAIALTNDIVSTHPRCKHLEPLQAAWKRLTDNNQDLLSASQIKLAVKKSKIAIIRMWLSFDKDGSGDLNKEELQRLIHTMNFDSMLGQKLLAEVKKLRNNSRVRFNDFVRIYKSVVQCSELAVYWHQAQNHAGESGHELAYFLQHTQRLRDPEAVKKEVAAIEQRLCGGSVRTLEEFVEFLTDRELNCALDMDKISSVYQDMTLPLCDYFISSSHNTYLIGDQLQSKSDPQMYAKALLDGCRCVELDCWDGKDGKTCVIYHGFTRTTKIPFEEVIDAIAANAFVTSEYPVTLSLELHVSVEVQKWMVQIMKQKFGARLAAPTWKAGETPQTVFSPANYMNKFIIKAKRLPADATATTTTAATTAAAASSEHDDGDDEDDDDQDKVAEIEAEKKQQLEEKYQQQQQHQQSGKVERYTTKLKKLFEPKKSKLASELSDLVIMEGKHFKSWAASASLQPHHVCSIGELKARALATSSEDDAEQNFRQHNGHCLSRIYPAGFRIDSSNLHPQQYWNVGCQLVAMNWQSSAGYELRFYKGRFIDNGGCGYVLKPEWMRLLRPASSSSSSSSSSSTTTTTTTTTTTSDPSSSLLSTAAAIKKEGKRQPDNKKLQVSVISAMSIPKPKNSQRGEIVDPYCYCFLEGPGIDGKSQPKLRTSTIQDNGFHPVWQGKGNETLVFDVPFVEMTTLCFQVYDYDVEGDELLCEAFLPLHLLREGVRSVPMWSRNHNKLASTFVMAEFEWVNKDSDALPKL